MNLIERMAVETQLKIDAVEAVMKQFMVDTLQIAIHREFGWGYDRILRLTERWASVYSEFYGAMNGKRAEADYQREVLDRLIAEIIGDKMPMVPFDERYPDLRKITYGRIK